MPLDALVLGEEVVLITVGERGLDGATFLVKEDGTTLPQRGSINFAAGVVATDNAGQDRTDITVTTGSIGAIPTSSIGVANGVAPLGSDGIVPDVNLPASSGSGITEINGDTGPVVTLDAADVGAVDLNQIAAANGVASLDSGGKVPDGQIPAGITRDSEAAAAYQPLDAELTAIGGLTSAADRLAYFTGSGTASLATFTAAGRALVDDADAAAQRATLGLVIGTDVQPNDSDLTAIAALTTTSFGRSFLALADAAAARTLTGSVIGTDVQAQNVNLSAIAALSATSGLLVQNGTSWFNRSISGTGGRISVSSGSGAGGNPTINIDTAYVGQTTITTLGTIATGTWSATAIAIANGGTGATDASGARTALGLAIGSDVQAFDSDLASIAALSTTSFGRAFLTLADAAATRTALGLVIGTDVQAQDAELSAIAGLTSAADKLPYFTGSGTAALADLVALQRANIARTRQTFSNADATASATAEIVAQTGTMSAARTVTLPAANALTAGQRLTILDESGSVTSTNKITIARAGSDTINGSANSISIFTANGRTTLESDGSTKWTVVYSGALDVGKFAQDFAVSFTSDVFPYYTGTTGVPTGAIVTSAARSILDDTTVAAMWTTLGGGGTIGSPSFTDVTVGGIFVLSSQTKTITATTDTIPITTGYVKLNNTSGSSKTLAPAASGAIMAAGTNGQIVVLRNISANDVVLQDLNTLSGSNLSLMTTSVTITPRDTLMLQYDSTLGHWEQMAPLSTVI